MQLNIAMIFELGPDDEGHIGGGVELHATNLAKMLSKMGHSVTYITGAIPNCKEKTEIDGVSYYRLDIGSLIKKTYKPQQLSFFRQFLFLLRTRYLRKKGNIDLKNIDIFHGHIYSSGLAALLLGSKLKKKVINTIHGSYYKHWKNITNNPLRAFFYRIMEKRLAIRLAKKSDVQIHTDYDYAELVKSWVRTELHSKIVTILNGVDTNRFNPQVEVIKKIKKIKKPIIMTTRRLVTKNGVIYLVRAFKKIIEKESGAQLVIIGDGPEKEKIDSEIEYLELTENVHLIGMVPNQLIPEYLAGADIVVVPSIVEASSISVLEAMAMKKPVVASDIPGIREITSFGDNCILVPSMNTKRLAEGILQLLNDKFNAEKLAKKGYQEVIKNYSWEKKAKEIEEIYIKIKKS